VSVRAGHVSALNAFPDFHKDPFDRILIAQALAEGLTVVTSDEQIRRYSVKTVW
jgi:PIN domain nuclease of toxin-antitoxin system